MIIKLTNTDLELVEDYLKPNFEFTSDQPKEVIERLKRNGFDKVNISFDMEFIIELIPKYIRSKSVVGYRDTRTDKIYVNSRLRLSKSALIGLALHEAAHRVGYSHHNKHSWTCRKMQNKLWYNKEKKLRSVNYQLTKVAKEVWG